MIYLTSDPLPCLPLIEQHRGARGGARPVRAPEAEAGAAAQYFDNESSLNTLNLNLTACMGTNLATKQPRNLVVTPNQYHGYCQITPQTPSHDLVLNLLGGHSHSHSQGQGQLKAEAGANVHVLGHIGGAQWTQSL